MRRQSDHHWELHVCPIDIAYSSFVMIMIMMIDELEGEGIQGMSLETSRFRIGVQWKHENGELPRLGSSYEKDLCT